MGWERDWGCEKGIKGDTGECPMGKGTERDDRHEQEKRNEGEKGIETVYGKESGILQQV